MEGDDELTEVGAAEQRVLDHLRAHAHQTHRVLVEATIVASHVEHAEQIASRREDRRGRAGKAVIGGQEMFIGVHDHRRPLVDGSTDGVGALLRLTPVDSGPQRHLGRLLLETVVTNRMQHHALGVGQHHHAVGIDDLLVQRLHHRCGVTHQLGVLLAQQTQISGGERVEILRLVRAQAGTAAAVP